jgi:hypothetical protein
MHMPFSALSEGINKGLYWVFEQVFKNIDDILHKDVGCSSELDYIAKTSVKERK